MTRRISFLPDRGEVRWQSSELRREVAELQARPGLNSRQTEWDGALDEVQQPRPRARGVAGP